LAQEGIEAPGKGGHCESSDMGVRYSAMHRAYSSKSMRQYVGVDAVAISREKVQLEAAQARPARHLRSLFRPTFPPADQHRRQTPSHCHCLRPSIDFPWLRSPRYVGSRRGLPRSSCAVMAPGEVCKRRLETPENGPFVDMMARTSLKSGVARCAKLQHACAFTDHDRGQHCELEDQGGRLFFRRRCAARDRDGQGADGRRSAG